MGMTVGAAGPLCVLLEEDDSLLREGTEVVTAEDAVPGLASLASVAVGPTGPTQPDHWRTG